MCNIPNERSTCLISYGVHFGIFGELDNNLYILPSRSMNLSFYWIYEEYGFELEFDL